MLKLKLTGLQNDNLHTVEQLTCGCHSTHTEGLSLILPVISFLEEWVKAVENFNFGLNPVYYLSLPIAQVLLIFSVCHALPALPWSTQVCLLMAFNINSR